MTLPPSWISDLCGPDKYHSMREVLVAEIARDCLYESIPGFLSVQAEKIFRPVDGRLKVFDQIAKPHFWIL